MRFFPPKWRKTKENFTSELDDATTATDSFYSTRANDDPSFLGKTLLTLSSLSSSSSSSPSSRTCAIILITTLTDGFESVAGTKEKSCHRRRRIVRLGVRQVPRRSRSRTDRFGSERRVGW